MLVFELKWDQGADIAIDQMKEKQYADRFPNALLIGISYDKKRKKHTCKIETVG